MTKQKVTGRVGEPLSPARRKAIADALHREQGNITRVTRQLKASPETVRRIRDEENIAALATGEVHRIAPEVEAAIVAELKEDPNVSNVVIAERHSTTDRTVRAIRVRNGIQPPVRAPAAVSPKLDASPEARERIALKDEVTRLKRELEKAQRETLDNEAMRILLGRMADFQPDPPKWMIDVPKRGAGGTPEVPVIMFNDWHYGEVVPLSESGGVNEYNPTIARERVGNLVKSVIHLCRNHGPKVYPGAVLGLAGDFISGGLHPELLKTDALEQIPASKEVFELLIGAIDELLAEFGWLYIPCSAGNHGRGTQKPEFKRYVYKNFDWLIYQLLAKYYEARGEKRVYFDIPDANEVYFNIWGLRFLLMHGDMLGVKGGDGIIGSLGPIARGEVKVSKQSAALGKDVDMLLIGHYHQDLWLPRVTVSNCLIGFNEFGRLAVRAVPAPPSQALFFVHPTRGITSRWNVMVDAPNSAAKSTEWVSFEKR